MDNKQNKNFFTFWACSIVKYHFFNEKLIEIYKETTEPLIEKNIKCFDDILYTYAAMANGFQYLRIKNYSIQKYKDLVLANNGFSENYSKTIKNQMYDYHNLLRNYIKEKYKIELNNLINMKIKFIKYDYLTNIYNLLNNIIKIIYF